MKRNPNTQTLVLAGHPAKQFACSACQTLPEICSGFADRSLEGVPKRGGAGDPLGGSNQGGLPGGMASGCSCRRRRGWEGGSPLLTVSALGAGLNLSLLTVFCKNFAHPEVSKLLEVKARPGSDSHRVESQG